MTIEELEQWIASSKRQAAQSGQDISDYEVTVGQAGQRGWQPLVIDYVRADHGCNEVRIFVEEA